MNIACARCGKELPLSFEERPGEEGIIRGVCKDCAESQLFQKGINLSRFLDNLPDPVFAPEDTARVLSANRRACELIGKAAALLEERMCGEVLECDNARLPGGCGAPDCSRCAVRQAIITTYRTGKPARRVPAPLLSAVSGETRRSALLISTEKIGDCVLLRIDAFRPGPDIDN